MTSSRRAGVFASLIILVAFAAISCSGGNSETDGGAGAPPISEARQANERILGATSPFEDLAESAAVGDETGVDRSLAAIGELLPAMATTVGPPYDRLLEDRVTQIRAARAANDNSAVALNSVEAFGILMDALNPAALTVPREVSRLDYIGFKVDLLGASASPDWVAIRRAAEEAPIAWNEIETGVRDGGLRDAVNTALAGLGRAVELEDGDMLRFATRMILVLVDLLESYFEQAPHAGT